MTDYSFLLPAILAAVVTLIAVVLTYILQLRAAERQRSFDRKRQAYEKALNSLRRLKSLAGTGIAFLRVNDLITKQVEKLLEPVPEGEKGAAKARLGLFIDLIHGFFLSVTGGRRTESQGTRIPSETNENDDFVRLAHVGLEMVRSAMMANQELDESLLSLQLCEARPDIRAHLEAVRDRLIQFTGDSLSSPAEKGNPDWSWFEKETNSLVLRMQDDLRRTLSPLRGS
jgi:hypothetical protein